MKGLPPQPAPGLTITDGTPVTFAAAFAPLRPHVGAAVTLRLATAVGGLRAGEHAVTILDWSTLDADARSGFAESHLFAVATSLGRPWRERLAPIAIIGRESHPVPPDELDQQADGVLILDLTTGAVLLCEDSSDDTTRAIARSTAELVLT